MDLAIAKLGVERPEGRYIYVYIATAGENSVFHVLYSITIEKHDVSDARKQTHISLHEKKI